MGIKVVCSGCLINRIDDCERNKMKLVDLKKELLATGNDVLVEASPYDSVWGIGMKATDSGANDPSRWKGQNLLGGILARVRDRIEDK